MLSKIIKKYVNLVVNKNYNGILMILIVKDMKRNRNNL